MIKTVIKHVGKGWGVLSGLFFLLCALLKFVVYLLPNYALMPILYSYSSYQLITKESIFAIIEIIAYFSLALLAFSGKRSNSVMIPISMLGFVIVENAVSRVIDVINDVVTLGVRYTVFADALMLFFALCAIISFLLLMIEINVNISCQKGKIAIKILATVAILVYILSYGAYLIGDIFDYFTGMRFEYSMLGSAERMNYLIIPIIDNLKLLVSCFGFFFLCIWMAVKPKEIDIYVPQKITDEELFKGVVVDPNMIKMSEPEEEVEATAEAEEAAAPELDTVQNTVE